MRPPPSCLLPRRLPSCVQDRRIDRRDQFAREFVVDLPPHATYGMEQIAWDSATLRNLLWAALGRARLSTIDLMRVRTRTPSSWPSLGRVEFVRMIRHLFRPLPPAVWAAEMRSVAEAVFDTIAGRHDSVGGVLSRKVDVGELERWLAVADGMEGERVRGGEPNCNAHAASSGAASGGGGFVPLLKDAKEEHERCRSNDAKESRQAAAKARAQERAEARARADEKVSAAIQSAAAKAQARSECKSLAAEEATARLAQRSSPGAVDWVFGTPFAPRTLTTSDGRLSSVVRRSEPSPLEGSARLPSATASSQACMSSPVLCALPPRTPSQHFSSPSRSPTSSPRPLRRAMSAHDATRHGSSAHASAAAAPVARLAQLSPMRLSTPPARAHAGSLAAASACRPVTSEAARRSAQARQSPSADSVRSAALAASAPEHADNDGVSIQALRTALISLASSLHPSPTKRDDSKMRSASAGVLRPPPHHMVGAHQHRPKSSTSGAVRLDIKGPGVRATSALEKMRSSAYWETLYYQPYSGQRHTLYTDYMRK